MRSGTSLWQARAHVTLRGKTRRLHKLLDGCFNASTLGERPEYVRFLLTNWPIAWIEPALASAGIQRLLPDWQQRRRHLTLVADLKELGVCPGPPCNRVIDADTGTLLGWAYVLEGSRLGARLIHQIVEASGGPELLKATRFIQHGEKENYWKTFAGVLSQIDRDDSAIANAASAAQTAFERFLEAARLQSLTEVTDSSQQRPA
jgi:heme oxygenase (biliverdin-IX-beta and delta-forming)